MGCGVTKLNHDKALDPGKALRRLSTNTRLIIKDWSGVPAYVFQKVLGQGKYGRVLLWESSETKHKIAVKAIIKGITPLSRMMEEVSILSKVDHPSIVRYIKAFQTERYIHLIMEYCEGDNLFQRILAKDKFNEAEACKIMEELLRAINHCHHLGIIHRDLKPENIMYSEGGVLKILDFGLSMQEGTYSQESMAGTKYYIAPEVVKDSIFTKACDIWSLGIIMHLLLTGYLPVGGKTASEFCVKLIDYPGPRFTNEMWASISEEAKDLLRRMLDKNHLTRITAAEALEHRWFRQKPEAQKTVNLEIMEALRKYSESSQEKRKFLNVIVKGTSDSELKNFQQDFLNLDKQKTGLITSKELHEYLKEKGYEISVEKLEEFTKQVNDKGEPCINYTEFIAAAISTHQFLTDEKLEDIFKILDIKQKGRIKLGMLNTEKGDVKAIESLAAMTKAKDTSHDVITFEEFKNIMLS
eukprot:TRINITY_DN2989_c0_g1_i5.p1 TRINITY_DN2989_c0_g1~~TRINITY_DN2989_c0_g1_i5.p1  ORF type:complete len:469 (+),score=114.65 TRINITY_DN2989_c0_g1_i5:100-1506(+)